MVNIDNLKKTVVLLDEAIESLKYHSGPLAVSLHRVLTTLISSLPEEDRDKVVSEILDRSTTKAKLYNKKVAPKDNWDPLDLPWN